MIETYLYQRMTSLLAEAEKTEKLLRDQLKLNEMLFDLFKYQAETVKELLEYALDHMLTLFCGKMGFLILYDEAFHHYDWNNCATRNLKGLRAKEDNGISRLKRSGVLEQLVGENQPWLLADVEGNSSGIGWLARSCPGTCHFLLAPYLDENQVVALVGIGSSDRIYEDSDLLMIQTYLSNLYHMVEQKRTDLIQKEKKQEMVYLSYHDPLTGMYNRRFLEEELARHNTRRNLPISLVFADVNGLKMINDTFGHERGDELIRLAAEVIKGCCREDDLAARVGGDEFVILLPRTKKSEAMQIIGRIQDLCLKKSTRLGPLSISMGCETRETLETDVLEVLRQAETQMYHQKIQDAGEYRSSIQDAILASLQRQSKAFRAHAQRVIQLALGLGKACSLSEQELGCLGVASRYHDIGFLSMESKLWGKSGKLTREDWSEIRRHPEIGYRLVSILQEGSQVGETILAHHEWWNGEGYPKGLRGADIPLTARILSIAEAFDAMTHSRSLECSLSEEAALEELKRGSGTQFDPSLVELFDLIYRQTTISNDSTKEDSNEKEAS